MAACKNLALGAVLVVTTVAVYLPVMQPDAGFLGDDEVFLWESAATRDDNGLVRAWFPFTRQADADAWTWKRDPEVIDYWPLTLNAFWIQWRLFDGEARRAQGWAALDASAYLYHRVTVAFHVLAVVLLWLLLARLKLPGAWLAALVFAVHPVAASSVGWISELKNTLSLCLFLGALLLFLRFDTRRSPGAYLASLAAFTLALAAKTSVVMLPVVLLGYAWWRRGSITRSDILAASPFFALSLAMGLMTIWFQLEFTPDSAPLPSPETIVERLGVAGANLWFYLYHAVLPVNLMMIYPRWEVGVPHLLGTTAAAGAAAFLLWKRSDPRFRPMLAGLGYFALMLAPVLGFIDMDYMMHSFVADHLGYVALPGVVALIVGAAWAWSARAPRAWRRASSGVAAVAVVALCIATYSRAELFAHSTALWQDTIARNPSAWGAYRALGVAAQVNGNHDDAIRHFRRAVEHNPEAVLAHYGLGNSLQYRGELHAAARRYRRVLEIAPRAYFAHLGLAQVLERQGALAQAVQHYRQGKATQPASHVNDVVHSKLGNALRLQGNLSEAIAELQTAVALNPHHTLAHLNLARSQAALGRVDEAVAHYESALKSAPRFFAGVDAQPDPRFAASFGHRGAPPDEFLAGANAELGEVLLGQREPDRAIAYFRAALSHDPGWLPALNGLAWALANHPDAEQRDLQEAIRLARDAAKRTGFRNPVVLGTLAMAYRADGQIEKSNALLEVVRKLEAVEVREPRQD